MERMGKSSTPVTTAPSPVVRRRELAALLRELRTDAGLTVEEVAEALLCSPSKVSRMETGQRTVSLRDIRDLVGLYKVSAGLREHLTTLAKGSKEQGWWQPYDLPSSYATYVGLEADALRISNYDPGVVPGLLQTPEYARAVDEGTLEPLSDEGIDKRIEVLQGRQEILTRDEPPPPEFCGIVDEAALHRIVGSSTIMNAALERVIEVSELRDVGIQVLPYTAGAHPALDSTFVLLEFRDPLGPMVYVEGLVGRMWLESSEDVKRYKQVFESLQRRSLSERDSIRLMKKLAVEYKQS
jgi:transcriptional regulator with XRE-family HTH domain